MAAQGPPTPRDPDCWRCCHSAHMFACEFCDCPTSAIGAAFDHDFDVEE